MRKIIGIFIMVFVIGIYVIAMKGRTQNDKSAAQKETVTSIDGYKNITHIEEKIDTAYPEKPAEVMAFHNELMKIFYSQIPTGETLEDYARTIRKLYSTELQNLNLIETQVRDLETEKAYNESLNITLVVSQIKEIYISKSEERGEEKAEVNVMHITNQGTLYRTYFLINEEGLWKIDSWENKEAVNTSSTETTSSEETKLEE